MPVLRKNQQQEEKQNIPEEVLKDNDEVFYCELTKEIFRNYEDYFQRVMLLNSTVWICSLTSRPNLTYAEALDCEKDARKMLKSFKSELKTPIIFVASLTQRSGISDMVDDIMAYFNVRFFPEEIVMVLDKPTTKWRECQVLAVLPPADTSSGNKFEPADIQYRVKKLNVTKPHEPFIVKGNAVRRNRYSLTKDKIKLFLKQCVECNNIGQLKIKESCYNKYVVDAGIKKFSDIFVGKPPKFELSKTLKNKIKSNVKKKKSTKDKDPTTTGDKKQATISNYFSKNDVAKKDKAESKVTKEKKKEEIERQKLANKTLQEEMLRKRKEEEAKKLEMKKALAEEKERMRVELLQMVQGTVRSFNQHRDDLELQDQKMLPVAKPVQTLISKKYFGDALSILEIICSFQVWLEDKEKFTRRFNLALLERSLLCREIAGPLSDLIQVLLGTIFSLQIEESNEVDCKYVLPATDSKEQISDDVRDATNTAIYVTKYMSPSLSLLPMDATSVSELLRLHLLMSGARVDETCSQWRYHHRGGYCSTDDPGLLLRQKYPHIIRALNLYTVYQLPFSDIIKILQCLVGQIFTYSTIRDTIEDRIDKAYRSRIVLKNIIQAERKRETLLTLKKKEMTEAMKKTVEVFEGTAEDKKKLSERLQADLDTKIKHLDWESEKAKKLYTSNVDTEQQGIFSYQLLLGTDRAYRNYWLFESLPGLFIEQRPFEIPCIENPVQNINELAACAPQDRYNYIKQMVVRDKAGAGGGGGANDKENKVDNNIGGTTKQTTLVNGGVDGNKLEVTAVAAATVGDKKEIAKLTQRDLFMCTGQKDTCPVHVAKDSANRVEWSFLHTEEELNSLIGSLNPRGFREKYLKEKLETERQLILNHIVLCPSSKLQIEPAEKLKSIDLLLKTKEYTNSNMNFPLGTDINVIVESTLADNILEMEMNLTNGHLATLRVHNREAWRTALQNYNYDMQCDVLKWGPNEKYSEGEIKKVNGISPDKVEEADNFELGQNLGNTTITDMDDTMADDAEAAEEGALEIKEEISLHDSPVHRKKVHQYASALLQIALGIDQKFMKPPFGCLRDLKDKAMQEKILKQGKEQLELWCVSIMKSTNFSQLFLHYNILYDSVKWAKSTLNATCLFCRKKSDPDKMLLCDGCNRGKHLYCFKPKLVKVPLDDWFCETCKPPEKKEKKKVATKRKIFTSVESDEDSGKSSEGDSDNESDSDDAPNFYRDVDLPDAEDDMDEEDCIVCNKSVKVKNLAICCTCAGRYHYKCAKPILTAKPSKKWQCQTCIRKKISRKSNTIKQHVRVKVKVVEDSDDEKLSEKTTNKRKIQDDEEEEEEEEDSDDETLSKRIRRFEHAKPKECGGGGGTKPDRNKNARRSNRDNDDERSSTETQATRTSLTSKKRSSRRMDDDESVATQTSRRSRRAEESDSCLLDSVIFYDLLAEIAKHKDSWPFDRPVNKQEVPDYYDVIETPMDFAKIKSNLNCGAYRTTYDILNDIQMVFTNCDLYNTYGSEIYKAGVNLEKFIQRRCADLKLPFKASDMLAEASK